ncbi:MAG: hypothetical protein JW759_06520 [Candidatus Coatesbacteria bacterium]|nr:hypothetical protein [Candidatus Coatesbacteria bacterium]
MKDWEASARVVSSKAAATGVFFLALFLPGAGHLALGRKKKAVLLAAVVFATFFLGVCLHGKLFAFEKGQSGSETLINYIGALAGLGNGVLYILGVGFGFADGRIEERTFEIGVTFLLSAGLFNILAAVDAYRCSIGYDYDAAEAARLEARDAKKARKRAEKSSKSTARSGRARAEKAQE